MNQLVIYLFIFIHFKSNSLNNELFEFFLVLDARKYPTLKKLNKFLESQENSITHFRKKDKKISN